MQDAEKVPVRTSPFRVGDFQVDPGVNRITGAESARQVEPKAMQVLCVLAARAGETVTREELLSTVWSGRVVVEETLTRAVSQLRAALKDGSSERGYIQTVPKQGYRLIAPVSETVLAEPHVSESAPRKPGLPMHRLMLAGVVVILVLLGGVAYYRTVPETPDPVSITAVAVLPFQPMDDSAETAYLADGVAEELINALAGVPDLRVPSRHTSFAFRNKPIPLAQMAAALDVGHVLEGSIRRAGNALRINARLVDVDTDTTLWSRQFDGDMREVFEVQEAIAGGILSALGQSASVADTQAQFARSDSMDAYSLYLQGKYWWMNGTTSNWFYQARDAFEQAVALDPAFAEAHASLAYVYARHDFHDQYMPADIAIERSETAIDSALALDEQAVDAHLARAILATSRRDFAIAEQALARAREIRPRNAVTHYLYSEMHIARNEPDKALESARRAVELDPLSAWVNVNAGIVHYYLGDLVSATAAIDEAIRIDPEYPWAYVWRAMVMHADGRLAEAVRAMRQCLALDPVSESNAALMGLLYLDLQERAEARHWFERAAALQGDGSSARLWDRMISLAYDRNDDEMLLALATEAHAALHNSRYSLVPVIHSAYLAQIGPQAARVHFSSTLPVGEGGLNAVSPVDSPIALALAASGRDASLVDAIERGLLAYPRFYRFRGLEAAWYLLNGAEQAALSSLEAALDDGWLVHWWMIEQAPAFSSIRDTARFQQLAERARLHAAQEAARLQADR